ncbi:plasmid stabilization protein [Neorhizobium sp. SOG26]|uniref:Type II toxin-antitoxin system RelE/ParE family toxin n=2 Tax=Neorhizobium turbinariae TaxID=2937795 RepID=A0ABT0IRQ9_9HYPH|nr:type II toxin-antitoxin system RelE/ParE family toxin [Neorhizobium sp. SOG26]AXV14672.1 plasmid stabilization protein [Neorhizobium sp. SOG26]MCK8780535.1 type II toxin-antitoxin system RelE/ParE family toxin [Neorhizobium turbinariae]
MSRAIRLTKRAREDIHRLYGFLLRQDRSAAQRAYLSLEKGIAAISEFPFSYRKVDAENAFLREMLIPFGNSGYVVLFEIEENQNITILAVRHQREDDYH